jgi:hypothetical protein
MNGAARRPGQDDAIPLERPKNLILYVSKDHPTKDDLQAENAMKAFDPSIRVERVEKASGIPTPRLRYARGSFWGLDSIQSFINQTRLQEDAGLF